MILLCSTGRRGASFFHFANMNQRYGITINYINIGLGQLEYLSTGIVIEMNAFKYFYGRLGTIGYLSLNGNSHLFGITSNIGFEYPFNYFVLSAGYKSDAFITSGLPANHNFYIQTSFRIDRPVKKKEKEKIGYLTCRILISVRRFSWCSSSEQSTPFFTTVLQFVFTITPCLDIGFRNTVPSPGNLHKPVHVAEINDGYNIATAAIGMGTQLNFYI